MLKRRGLIDRWDLWLNTDNEPDLLFCQEISQQFSWVKLVPLIDGHNGSVPVALFYSFAQEANTIYVKIDDDIVYLDVETFASFIDFRIKNPDPLLVFGNIVNNALIAHLHQRQGLLPIEPVGFLSYSSYCWKGLNDPAATSALLAHRLLLDRLHTSGVACYHFNKWYLWEYERCSINYVSWIGHDMAHLSCALESSQHDDEAFLTERATRDLKRPCVIFGGHVVSHFAFKLQRAAVDASGILSEYDHVAPTLESVHDTF